MFDPYPRHSHRTPQQIAEDTGGTFEPTRPHRRAHEHDGDNDSMHGAANNVATAAESKRTPDVSPPR